MTETQHSGAAHRPPQPRRSRLVLIATTIVVFLAVLFAAGYLPKRMREHALAASVKQIETSVPLVNAARARVSPSSGDLLLPGNITPLIEASLNARAEGYLKKRYVDFGDQVKNGQLLAEIEAPELDQQVQQARATVSQSEAALAHTQHALVQSQANLRLSQVTAERWKTLTERGVVSRQEFDQKQAQFEADRASVQSAEADVRAAEDNVRASQANLQRLVQLQDYEKVTAPFAGIITARNLDLGALISASTPIFRIAMIDTLRIMVDVPEQSSPFIKIGEPAELTLQEFPGRSFSGKVSRTANALDANTRTLPTEIQVGNPSHVLMPNMYANVRLIGARATPWVLIPGDSLVVRTKGAQVAVVGANNLVHFQSVEIGRDYGPELEIRSGLTGNEIVIINPTDDVREGVAVKPVFQRAPPAAAVQPPANNGKAAADHNSKSQPGAERK
jgi:RND family efflux transporter MFP subunit